MISMKMKRIMTSIIMGRLFRIVDTRLDMLGILVMVRRGLMILMTLMALTSPYLMNWDTQPNITTTKSNTFHPSLRYEWGRMKKPMAMILSRASIE